jgi:FixJ family two-component response regulator
MKDEAAIVAIVEDDDRVRRALRRLIRSFDLDTTQFGSGEEFLAAVRIDSPACAVVDLHMPKMTGLELLLSLRARGHTLPVIIITGFNEVGMHERCLAAGATAYLLKPIDATAMAKSLSLALSSEKLA